MADHDEEMAGLRSSQRAGIKAIMEKELGLAFAHVEHDAAKRLLLTAEDVRRVKVEVLDAMLDHLQSFIFLEKSR